MMRRVRLCLSELLDGRRMRLETERREICNAGVYSLHLVVVMGLPDQFLGMRARINSAETQ